MMPLPVLQIDHLNLATSQGPLTEDLSLDVNKGEIVTLTGKSGTGKSSLALAIMGLLPPGVKMSSGQIRFFLPDGILYSLPADQNKWHELRGKHIGFIQQDVFGAFDPVIRMGKQLMMIINERSPEPEAYNEAGLRKRMTDVGLHDTERIWNSFPHQLSGGQLQRCLLCICLVTKPSLIIADEPTSAIDKTLQKDLLEVLLYVRRELNTAFLCITHDPWVVQYIAERTVSLDSGETVTAKIERYPDKVKAPQDIILDVKNLGYAHSFGGVIEHKGAVINKLTFQMKKGQRIGIVGASGSGKSTLAQMLVGLLVPTEGEVIVDNQPIIFNSAKSVRYLRSKVQLVMQDGRGSLHPYKTIRATLNEVRHSMTLKPGSQFDLVAKLQEVGLPAHILDRKPDQLSGGECLRLSIVRALMLQPEILICDESTSALDEPTRDSILLLLQSLLHKRELSLIMIAHDPAVITLMTNHVMVFDRGTIVEQGETVKMTREPVHPVAKTIFSLDATVSGNPNL